jgi:hypothetical protein
MVAKKKKKYGASLAELELLKPWKLCTDGCLSWYPFVFIYTVKRVFNFVVFLNTSMVK